jgi:hypothetical protein
MSEGGSGAVSSLAVAATTSYLQWPWRWGWLIITAKAKGGAARQQVIETVRDGARFKYKLMGFMFYF